MNDGSEYELLRDLAKLLKKYGPEVFEKLAALISAPSFTEQLASLLKAAASGRRESSRAEHRSGKHARASDALRSQLVSLEQSDPNKAALLIKFYDDLRERR